MCAFRAARSQRAMSTPAIDCAKGPGSPDCKAKICVLFVRVLKASTGDSQVLDNANVAM